MAKIFTHAEQYTCLTTAISDLNNLKSSTLPQFGGCKLFIFVCAHTCNNMCRIYYVLGKHKHSSTVNYSQILSIFLVVNLAIPMSAVLNICGNAHFRLL